MSGHQPGPGDDRMPVVLVILDGLGDRPIAELGDRTPAEAACTPVLDSLAARGASGWHIPCGWGPAPSSEIAHWALFGYADVPFPGRALLEAIGAGLDPPAGEALAFAALRSSRIVDGRAWMTGRAGRDDGPDTELLFKELAPVFARHRARLAPLGRGEGLLSLPAYACGDVTDSDPFFDDFHPWLKILPRSPAATRLAAGLNVLLREARAVLMASAVNRARRDAGKPPLDVLTTKWSGVRADIPAFVELAGVAGAAVTSTRLYRGLAGLLGMQDAHLPPMADLGADIAARLHAARQLIDAGARFVHVHVKATDEAGHTKQPRAKLEVLEALDPGLAGLHQIADQAIVAVTGDHATPSTASVLHTSDPTPLVVVGPTVRRDRVERFGEIHARDGWYGVVHASEVLPLLFSHANRPVFLGHRATPRRTAALPDDPRPMPLDDGAPANAP